MPESAPGREIPLHRKLIFSLLPAFTLLLFGELLLRVVGFQFSPYYLHEPILVEEAGGATLMTILKLYMPVLTRNQKCGQN